MIDSSRIFHIAKFAVPTLVLVWILFELSGDTRRTQYSEVFRQFRDQKDLFVDDFLTHEIDGNFEGQALSEFCGGNRTWEPGMILSCDGVFGTMGEAKNGILTCVRIAIEMGAEVVLPTIVKRSTIDLSIVVPGDEGPRRGEPLSYFFDHDHLTASLAKFCPKLKIHDSLDKFYDDPSLLSAVPLNVYKLPKLKFDSEIGKANRDGMVLAEPETLLPKIEAEIDKKSPPKGRKYPFRVSLRPTPMFLFPDNWTKDQKGNKINAHQNGGAAGAALSHEFGRLLRVRQDLRRLAATVLFNLQKTFNVDLDPRVGIQADRFAGVELRTEQDVWYDAEFPGYEFQASDVLNMLVSSNVTLALLGDGTNADNATLFAERALDFNIRVVRKADLLEGNDLALLNSLSYDQRGLVDYEIMLRAGLFAAGTASSSNAWNIALRRAHAFADAPSNVAMAMQPSNSSDIRWVDEYSTIFGKNRSGLELEATIWP